LWHSLTEDGKVEVVNIKFGNKVYEGVSVKHLKPTKMKEHKHAPFPSREDDDDEMKLSKKKKVKEVVINGKRYRSI
jgi:methionine-rich copper-binding protein CopC